MMHKTYSRSYYYIGLLGTMETAFLLKPTKKNFCFILYVREVLTQFIKYYIKWASRTYSNAKYLGKVILRPGSQLDNIMVQNS